MVKKRPFYLALFSGIHVLMSQSVKLSKGALTHAEEVELKNLEKKLSQYNLAEIALPHETSIKCSFGRKTFYSLLPLANFLATQARIHAWKSEDVLNKFKCTYLDWKSSEYVSLKLGFDGDMKENLDERFRYSRTKYSKLIQMYLRVQELRR